MKSSLRQVRRKIKKRYKKKIRELKKYKQVYENHLKKCQPFDEEDAKIDLETMEDLKWLHLAHK